MRKLILFLALVVTTCNISIGQTPEHLPFFTEDFENESNSKWTIVNETQVNKWYIDSTAYAGSYRKSAYISSDGGASNVYDINRGSITHIYHDIQFPQGEEFVLLFDWNAGGESSYDYLQVSLTDTTYSPVPGNFVPSENLLFSRLNFSNGWKQERLILPETLLGQTKRLVFTWRTDGSVGTQPPAAIDNIYISQTHPLAGVYTIDNTLPTGNRNFNTFKEALDTLNTNGTSDSVIFNVISGQVHNIAERLQIASGNAVDKPVVFRKSGNGANPLLKVTGTSNYSDAGFYLDGVSHITFDGLDIENAGTTSSNYLEQGFYLTNTSNVQLRNCSIQVRNTYDNYGIYTSGTVNALQIENVGIRDSYYLCIGNCK